MPAAKSSKYRKFWHKDKNNVYILVNRLLCFSKKIFSLKIAKKGMLRCFSKEI